MADPDHKIRVTTEDKSSATIKKIGEGFKTLSKEVQGSFKEMADKSIISIDQISKRLFQQSALSGKERISRAQETSNALHGIYMKEISAGNTWARAMQEQNLKAAASGKKMLLASEQAGEAATKASEKVVKSNRNWIASNSNLHKFYLDNKKAASEAGKAGEEAGTKAGRAQNVANAAVEAGVKQLSGMAAGYFSVSKAIDIAKKSFVGFAEFDDKMRLMQGSMGLTENQTEEFKEIIKRTARSVAEDTKEMGDAFKVLADKAGLSNEQIMKLYPQVSLMAKGANVSTRNMAASVADIMRNLKIAPEEAGQVMEGLWGATSKLNIDIGKLAPHLNEITTEMQELGYTGKDALFEALAVMGSLNDTTKDTTESAELYQRMLAGISSEWHELGFKSEASLRKFLKASESPAAALIDLYRTSKYQEELLAKTPVKFRRGLRKLMEDDNKAIVGDRKKMIEEMSKQHAGETAAMNRINGPMQQLNRMGVLLEQLGDQFGDLMNAFGATAGLKLLNSQLDELRRSLKVITDLMNMITSGKIFNPKNWHGKGINAAPWAPRYSKEEVEAMHKKGFWNYLLEGAPSGDTGVPSGPTAQPQSNTTPTNNMNALGQKVRFLSSTLVGPGHSQGSREVYGTSTDAKYLTADYRPSGIGGYGGTGGAGQGLGTPPEGMQSAGPQGGNRGGTSYGGGTTLAAPGGGVAPPATSDAVVGAAQSGGLAADRVKFQQEMANNPALRDKVLRIAANEQGQNPQGTQAVIESMMNRASHRGRTLAQEARWTGEGGYYEQGNMGRGALENASHRAILEGSLGRVLGGGNISDYATDNASQGLAAKRTASGEMVFTKGFGGESFYRPGRVSGAGNVRSHQAWMERMQAAQGGVPALAGQIGGTAPVRQMTEAMAPAGTPAGHGAPGGTVTIQSAGGRKFQVAAAYAQNFQGFINDYEKSGGVLSAASGGVGHRPHNASYHPRGMAIDVNQVGYGIRSKTAGVLPEGVEDALAAKWGLFPGSQFGSRSDRGHFEVRNAAAARAALLRNQGAPGAAAAAPGDVDHRMTPAQVAAGRNYGDDKEHLRKMGFVYDPDTGKPLRQFDPYTGAKLASTSDGVPGSAAGGVHPGIAAERDRRAREEADRKQTEADKDIAREKELDKVINDNQEKRIGKGGKGVGGESAPEGGGHHLNPDGTLRRLGPETKGVGGEAAGSGAAIDRAVAAQRRAAGRAREKELNASPFARKQRGINPHKRGAWNAEAAPEGGMPEPPEVAIRRAQAEQEEIRERRRAASEQKITDDANERTREAGKRVGRAPEPEEKKETKPDEAPAGSSSNVRGNNIQANMNVNVNSSQVQFARNTIDRQVYASLDRSRANSYHDITTA